MIIGHYDHEIWAKGGLATYIRRIAKAQQQLGHQIYFFSQQPCRSNEQDEEPIVVAKGEDLFGAAIEKNVDILHLHRSIDFLPPTRIPVIRTLHGHAPYCPSGSRYLTKHGQPCDRSYNSVQCLLGHFIDRCGSIRPQHLIENFRETEKERNTLPEIPVICVSQFIREQMLRSGYPAQNLHTLHLFAPDNRDTSPPPQYGIPHFVFLGRITPLKGVAWLLRAVAKVQQPIHLDIAGDGHEIEEMKTLAEQLGIRDRVTFHGWVSPEIVDRLIQDARALVFPSVWHEPGGTVAFEAMAKARAVIMSRVGGMPEVVMEGSNGLLVDPNNTDQLADALHQLAKDYDLARSLGEVGKQQASEYFTLERHLEKLMTFYRYTIGCQEPAMLKGKQLCK